MNIHVTPMQRGISLLDVLLTLLIVAILALPTWLQYKTQTQTAESLNMLGTMKGTVMKYYVTHKTFPEWSELRKISSMAQVPNSVGYYVDSLFAVKSWSDPASTYTLVAHFKVANVTKPLQNMAAIYLQTNNAGATWSCGPSVTLAAVYLKYLPSTCRTPITVQ